MTLRGGRFRLVDVVGTGRDGPVRRAWDRRDRRMVAVQRSGGPALEFPHLDHPHLLRPTELLPGGLSVSPLVRGGSVEQLLAAHGALPIGYVAVLLDQLLDALEVVHAAGWVHGDVKPGNLLLEPTGCGRPHLRLADFGAARRVGQHPTGAGTPGYAAPETRAGAPADPREDLFATGVTTAELLTGLPPRGPADVRRTRLRPLLVALVAHDPAERPSSAAEARSRLQELGVPAGAPWQERPRPPEVPERLRDPPRWWWRRQSR